MACCRISDRSGRSVAESPSSNECGSQPHATAICVGLSGGAVRPNGRAIGVDMTVAMRERALSGARASGLTNVDVRDGDATNLPVEDSTVDVVMSNGVLNLVPDKTKAVREIARVLKRAGRVQIADIVIGELLPDSALRDIDLWTG